MLVWGLKLSIGPVLWEHKVLANAVYTYTINVNIPVPKKVHTTEHTTCCCSKKFSIVLLVYKKFNLAIYFVSPFGRYPTFHTLTSVGRKKLSVC